jgi:hypothetical protein
MAPYDVFDHFVYQPDPSHMQTGHWKFSTAVDEKRAYVYGLLAPEQILQAVDRGEGALDGINLRWLPGEDDKSMTSPITGSAEQHLMEIYNARRWLGLSLSMRNQVPLYPIDSRLTGYWDEKRMPFALQPVDPADAPSPPVSSLPSPVPPSPSASPSSRASSLAQEANSLIGDASSSEGVIVILDKEARRIKKGVHGISYGTQRSRGQSCDVCRKRKASSHAPYQSQD